MAASSDPMSAALDAMVDEDRDRCLWFLRSAYYLATDAERLKVLGYMERYGDLEAFRRAGRLKRWLSRISSAPSAD